MRLIFACVAALAVALVVQAVFESSAAAIVALVMLAAVAVAYRRFYR